MDPRLPQAHLEATIASLGHGPWARADLVRLGWSPQQIQRAITAGRVVLVRRGVYALPASQVAPAGPLGASSLHARLRAVVGRLSGRAVVSHSTAAQLLDLWDPSPDPSGIHLTIPGAAEREDAGVRVHGSRLPEKWVTDVDGIRVTTPARTAVDLARGTSLPRALVAVDGALRARVAALVPNATWALREGQVPEHVLVAARDELDEAFGVVWSWPGSRVVRQAIDLAEPASESPFESWSRGWMVAVGLPQPSVNVEIRGASGRRYYGDFVWPTRRVIGEADGVGKYGSGQDMRSSLGAERRRQDDLEAAGWRVVRWVSGEPGRVVVARLARALYLAGPPTRAQGRE